MTHVFVYEYESKDYNTFFYKKRREMSDEYRSCFISSLIVDDHFDIDEFDNFKATVDNSSLPIFKDMQKPWKLEFEINDDEKLVWRAVEYDDEHGMEIMSGTVEVTVKNTPNTTYNFFDITDPDAHEFIETLFPGNNKVRQLEPNIFLVNRSVYNFNTMLSDKGYIHFVYMNVL